MECLLCGSVRLKVRKHSAVECDFYHCENCDLIFKDPNFFLDLDQQKLRYDLHENDLENPGYADFLMKLVKPLQTVIKNGDSILDWGSGPTQALVQLLKKMGYQSRGYDPIYQPQMPDKKFSAVISTEVIEHFTDPLQSFQTMLSFVKEGGVLAGMSEYHSENKGFENWWYAKDPTHICFYSAKNIETIAKIFKLKILRNEANIFILKK